MTWIWILLAILYLTGGIIFQHRATVEIRRALKAGIIDIKEGDVSWAERTGYLILWPLMLRNMVSGEWLPPSPIKLARWFLKGSVY